MALNEIGLLVVALTFAACSNEAEQTDSSGRRSSADTLAVSTAQEACKGREHEPADVGISDYEACLGEHANRTRPADPQLCKMARSNMSRNGRCLLGE